MSPQWSSTTRIIVASVGLIVLGLMFYFARPLIGPTIVAALLAYVLNPLVKLVKKRARLPHKVAVSLVYFLTLAVLIATPSTLIPVLINQIRSVSGYLAGVERQVEALLARQVDILGEPIHLDRLWGDLINVATQSLTPAEDPLQVLETTSISLAWLLVILVSTFYLLLSWEGLYKWIISLPPPSQQPDLERLLHETDQIWKAYLRGTLALMLIVGIVFTIIWIVIGLPGALVLGLLIGLLSVIPELGPAIAGVLAVAVAFLQGSDFLPLSNFWFAVLVAAIYLVLIQVKAIWLRPHIMGRFLHVNEGLVFVAIIGAVVLEGILGALIVVPLLATLGLVGRYVRAKLLNLDPWTDNRHGD